MGRITCIDQNHRGNEFEDSSRYTAAKSQEEAGLECVECPICMDCLRRPIWVQPGFHLAPDRVAALNPATPQDKAFLRCRPETAHTDGLGDDGTGYDAGKLQCL
eukprot:COSAG01_NODE_40244_length_466_cov_0.678474_1_plen_103_part_01